MIGRKIQVGIGKETSRGSVVTPTYWVPLLDPPSIENKPEYIDDTQNIGVIADSDNSEIVREKAEGELTGKIRDKSFGLILLASTGSVSSAVKGGESVVYEHTYSLQNDNQHQSLTVEAKNDNEQLAYALSMLNSLRINAELGKFVEFNAGFIAKKGVTASNTPSYDTAENEFISRHMTFKLADDLAGLGAASAISIQSLELSIEKNVEAVYKLGSDEPVDMENKVIAIEGNIEAKFDDVATFKTLVEGATQKAMRIDIVNSDTTIGTASNPSLRIDLAKVKFQDWDKSGGQDDIISQNIRFKAHYSMSDAKMFEMILTNLVASY